MRCKKTRSDYLYLCIILLLVMGISFYSYFYGTSGFDIIYSENQNNEAKAVNEYELKEFEIDSYDSQNGFISLQKSFISLPKVVSMHQRLSHIIDAITPDAIFLQAIFYFISLFLISILFIVLPDDWTLVDQKVRLDD